jgi:hypothetical protein
VRGACCERCLLWEILVVRDACCERCLLWEMLVVRGACCERCLLWEVLVVRDACCERCLLWEVLVVRDACCERCLLWEVLVVRGAHCLFTLLIFGGINDHHCLKCLSIITKYHFNWYKGLPWRGTYGSKIYIYLYHLTVLIITKVDSFSWWDLLDITLYNCQCLAAGHCLLRFIPQIQPTTII